MRLHAFSFEPPFGRARPGHYAQAMKNGAFPVRLSHAWAGIRLVWRREKTFRTHGLFALAALAVTAALRVGPVWWAMVILCIALVFALESLNSALEYVIDRLHPEIHEEIRCAKDAAAGAVLLASIGATIVGALMLLDWWRG
jgi:diacylglycerol kinase (ATP)